MSAFPPGRPLRRLGAESAVCPSLSSKSSFSLFSCPAFGLDANYMPVCAPSCSLSFICWKRSTFPVASPSQAGCSGLCPLPSCRNGPWPVSLGWGPPALGEATVLTSSPPAPQRPCGKGSAETRAPCSHPVRRPRPCSFEVAAGLSLISSLVAGRPRRGGSRGSLPSSPCVPREPLCPWRRDALPWNGHGGGRGAGPGAGLRSGGISRAAWTREQRWRHHFLAFGEPVIKDLKVQSPTPARGSVLGSAPPFQVPGPRALH